MRTLVDVMLPPPCRECRLWTPSPHSDLGLCHVGDKPVARHKNDKCGRGERKPKEGKA